MPRGGALIGAAAAALAATAAVNVYRARRAERRNPPRGRFVEVDGVRLHYLEKGEGPAVVLIHGNIVTAEDFVHGGLFDRLAANHRVIAIDRPGMGYSSRPRGRSWAPFQQAELFRHAFDALGIERPVVVGHSWGAMVAVALALNHPEAVRGLVLMGGYYYPTVRADTALALPPAIPVLGDVLDYTLSPLAGAAMMPAFLKGMFWPKPVPDRFAETFSTEMALRPRQIHAMSRDGAGMSLAAARMQHRYAELTMPVAIIAGAEDMVADVGRQSARLYVEVPHSSLRLIPEAGHMVHYAAPDKIAAVIDKMAGPPAGHVEGVERGMAATRM